MGTRFVIRLALAVLVLTAAHPLAQGPPDHELDVVLRKMAAYVDGYGEKASLIVAVEKYTQRVDMNRPRKPWPSSQSSRRPAGGWDFEISSK